MFLSIPIETEQKQREKQSIKTAKKQTQIRKTNQREDFCRGMVLI